jgi:hypothetical protein
MRLLIVLMSCWFFVQPISKLHAGASAQAVSTENFAAPLFFSLEKSAPEADKKPALKKSQKKGNKFKFFAKKTPKKSKAQSDGDFSVFEYILMGLATLGILAAIVLLIWGFAAGVLLWLIQLSFWIFWGQLLLHLILQLVISSDSTAWAGLRGIFPLYIVIFTSPIYILAGIILGAINGLLWLWLSLSILVLIVGFFILREALSDY